MKTLRVTLSDIVGGTGGSGSTAEVRARYVTANGRGRDVHLTDGTIVVPVRRSVTPGTGPERFDFTVIPSDDADVREADRGFLTEVSWTVTAPEGGKAHGVRRVLVPSTADAVVQLGSLYEPTEIPAVTAQRVISGGTASAPLYDIRIRHDDTAGWAAEDPVLSLGEEGIDTDTGVRKVGDGVTAWSSLPASGGGGGGGTSVHGDLTGRSVADQHPVSAITGLQAALDGKADDLGADDNYVTDAEKTKLANLSGTNTGDQTLPTWTTIAGKPAVVAAGATQADARTAIGAGTSSIVVGAGAGDAKAGNYQPTAANISDSTTTGRALLTAVDAAAARTTLGLGTAATTAATAYATAAQGTTADAALSAAAAPELIRDTMATALVAGTNVTITPNDGADTITIAASGGGGGGIVPPEPLIIPPGVGQYLPVLAYGGHFGFSCVSGRSYPCPQYAHEAMNVDAVGVMVETGVGGATIELALYTWGGGITSTLVSTLGSVDASSAGLKVLTFTPLSLTAGLHLIVARPSTNVSVRGVSGGTMVQDGPPNAGSNRFQFPHHAAASLPSSITWDYSAGVYGNNFPKFQMRRSA